MKKFLIILSLIIPTLAFAVRSKDERKALFQKATQELKSTGIEKLAPKVGSIFPDLKLGEKKVSEWVKTGPLIVTFYRGGWCPYCVKQLKEINQSLKGIKDLKANLIAISPETEMEVKKTKNKNNLDFLMLSDKNNELARKLGLVFTVDPEVEREYRTLGINLAQSQGNDKNELPMPATFVIKEGNVVRFSFADADYTKRANLEEVSEAVNK